jgi:N-formylglutamate deformylase
MNRLPVLVSVPHAGLAVPEELQALNRLIAPQIARDGDQGAAQAYLPLLPHVDYLAVAPVARAFVDMNRAPCDVRRDGVVKTHTCWDEPIYAEPLPRSLIATLIERYHQPYHERLARHASGRVLGLDCHTMAANGPPVGPDPGQPRPRVCLSDGDGASCPWAWFERLAGCLEETIGDVSLNAPFRGGYITRSRPGGIPWIQVELSRAPFMSWEEKHLAVLEALRRFMEGLGSAAA